MLLDSAPVDGELLGPTSTLVWAGFLPRFFMQGSWPHPAQILLDVVRNLVCELLELWALETRSCLPPSSFRWLGPRKRLGVGGWDGLPGGGVGMGPAPRNQREQLRGRLRPHCPLGLEDQEQTAWEPPQVPLLPQASLSLKGGGAWAAVSWPRLRPGAGP